MAEELVLIRKDVSEGAEVHDGVYAVLINVDDALTDAQIRTAAVTAVIPYLARSLKPNSRRSSRVVKFAALGISFSRSR